MRLVKSLAIVVVLLLAVPARGELVWLDFGDAPWPTFAGKSAADFEAATLAIVQADFADYTYLSFTTTNPGGTDYTQIEFRESAAPNLVGDAHIVDWDNKLLYQNNINYANNAKGSALDVYVSGFTGYGPPFTDSFDKFTLAVGTTTSHELGHGLGLQHWDTFGPSPVAGNPNPMADHHIMATKSTGLSATERTDYDRVFSDHSADKLAYLDPANKATRRRQELGDPYSHDTIATAEALTIGPADILPQTGRMAMTKVGTIFPDESDFYYFDAAAGDAIYANVFSARLTREDGITPVLAIDSVLRLYDPSGAMVYFNDDTGYESTSSATPGIGDVIGTGEKLFADELQLIDELAGIAQDGDAGGSAFTIYTTDSILLDSPSGDFFTLATAGRWTIEVFTFGEYDVGHYELFVVVTPEPATISLLALGAMAMLRTRRGGRRPRR